MCLVVFVSAHYDNWHGGVGLGSIITISVPRRPLASTARVLAWLIALRVLGRFVLLGLCWLGHECSIDRSWVSCWLEGYASHECVVTRWVAQVMSGGGPTLYYDLVSGVLNADGYLRRVDFVPGEELTRLVSFRFAQPPSTAPPHPTSGSVPWGLFESECFLGRRFPCLLTYEWPLAAGGPCIARSPLPMGPMARGYFPQYIHYFKLYSINNIIYGVNPLFYTIWCG
jgi:hypothetical protein